MKRFLLALAVGILITAALFGLANAAGAAGYPGVARALFWQNALLQSMVPLNNIGTPEAPFYEGTPLNCLAFIASVPLGVLIYSFAAYVILGFARRRT